MKRISIYIVIIFFLPLCSFAQQFSLSGKVLSPEGKPVPGASVYIKTLNRGIVTDDNGNFSFKDLKKGKYKLSRKI